MPIFKTSLNRILEGFPYVWVTVAFFLITGIYYATQDPILFNDGEGFDGVKYVDIVEQLRANETIKGPAPFVYRLATPYLTSLLPFDILTSYKILNLVFALLCGLLLYSWLQRTLNVQWLSYAFVLYFFLHWQASLRFTIFYPADCDPLAITFIIGGLLILNRLQQNYSNRWMMGLGILVFTGTFQREFIACLAFGVPFLNGGLSWTNNQIVINHKIFWRNLKASLLVLSAGILGIYITHLLVITETNGYGFLHAIYRWMHQKSVFQLLTGYFYTLGILFIFPFLFPKSINRVLKDFAYIVPILSIALVLSWISGGDTERFILWFCPIFFLIIGRVMSDHLAFFSRKRIYIPLLLSLLLTLRIFWDLPQFYLDDEGISYPFFAVFGKDNFVDILATHAAKWVTTVNLILYLLLSLYFIYWRFENKIRDLIRWE